MKIYADYPQGSDEWFAVRAGKATASEFASILAKGKGSAESKMRASYLLRLVAERLTGKPMETYTNAHMLRGKEQEPLARMAYELATDEIVQEVAFVQHDSLLAGCSPDGLIYGKPRGAEIKCVIPTVQLATIKAGGYPPEHKAQIQGSMWVTGFPVWDFCSHSPDLPAHLRTYIFPVERDEAYIKELDAAVRQFLAEVDQLLDKMNATAYRRAA